MVGTIERESFFRALAPTLPIGDDAPVPARVAPVPPWTSAGFVVVPDVVPAALVAPMAAAIRGLVDAGLPPVFAYVFDPFWHVATRLTPLADAVLGAHDLLADVWAWLVPCGEGNAGWPAHRGSYTLDGAGGRPAMLNAWIALSEATRANGCMHVVPLDRDPNYPARLDDLSATEGAVALEVAPGTALVWDANALHWGGASSAEAREPRISFSYTFRARGQRPGPRLPSRLDFRSRLDVIASQILVYGDLDPTLPEAIAVWARGVAHMQRLARKEG